MTATAASAAEEIIRIGLADGEPDQVSDRRPTSEAPDHRGDEADVQGAIPLHRRIHDVTVLSLIAVIQIAWIAALAYGVWLVA
ncbi:MAG TPA: hypothetical protein VFA97_10455 [Gaiellaceae bacterium]|nr:hypothetical protein [Gaiellaceae bacterium]